MPKYSKYTLKRKKEEKIKAFSLYKEGYTLREVSKLLKTMGISMHFSTICRAIKELSTD